MVELHCLYCSSSDMRNSAWNANGPEYTCGNCGSRFRIAVVELREDNLARIREQRQAK